MINFMRIYYGGKKNCENRTENRIFNYDKSGLIISLINQRIVQFLCSFL